MLTKLFLPGTVSLLLSCSLAWGAESYYVQTAVAKVYARPALNGAILGQVERGTGFTPGKRQGNWIKVTYQGKEGYVSALATAMTPPRTLTGGTLPAETGNAQIRLRSRASAAPAIVAGVKGLAYEERARASAGEKVDYEALDDIDSLVVSDDELASFSKGGIP